MRINLSTQQINRLAETAFDEAAQIVVDDAEVIARVAAPVDTGEYRSSFDSRKCSSTLWVFGNTAEHALFVEEGIRPFTYRNGATTIRFRGTNDFRTLRSHPGTQAQNILRDSVDQAIGAL